MIHHHTIGDAKITGVIEYSGPTHAPEFLYPAVDKAERDAVLKANASWLAPHHYAPNIDRLIVTIQLWVVRAGGNVIIIDTGVGNRKPRAAAARMDQLNTLVMPWLESIGAGPEQVTHVVMTHLHTDHVGWNTVPQDGKWVPTFPKANYLFPKSEFDYCKAEYAKDKSVNQGSFELVAYVDEPQVVALLVLSSRSKEALGEALPAFREVLKSYVYMDMTTGASVGLSPK